MYTVYLVVNIGKGIVQGDEDWEQMQCEISMTRTLMTFYLCDSVKCMPTPSNPSSN